MRRSNVESNIINHILYYAKNDIIDKSSYNLELII